MKTTRVLLCVLASFALCHAEAESKASKAASPAASPASPAPAARIGSDYRASAMRSASGAPESSDLASSTPGGANRFSKNPSKKQPADGDCNKTGLLGLLTGFLQQLKLMSSGVVNQVKGMFADKDANKEADVTGVSKKMKEIVILEKSSLRPKAYSSRPPLGKARGSAASKKPLNSGATRAAKIGNSAGSAVPLKLKTDSSSKPDIKKLRSSPAPSAAT